MRFPISLFSLPSTFKAQITFEDVAKSNLFRNTAGRTKKNPFTIHDPDAHKGISNDTIKSPNFISGHNFVTLEENFCDQMPGLFHQI